MIMTLMSHLKKLKRLLGIQNLPKNKNGSRNQIEIEIYIFFKEVVLNL